MAIVKLGTYRNPPEDITDYEAIAAHLEAYTRQIGNQGMILTEWTNTTNAPKIAMGSYISHGGVLYVVDTEDYGLPALSSDGTYYLRVAASGDTLAITYTTNIADYSWNAVYCGLYHADESQVLHYQVIKSTSVIWKFKMLNPYQIDDFAVVNYLGRYYGRGLHVTGAISGASVGVTGAISGATINTGGLGAFLIGQNLRITDSPTFAGLTVGAIDTGHGATDVFPISNEGINFGFVSSNPLTKQIGGMNIGDIKFVYTYGTLNGASTTYSARLIAPAGGSFVVVYIPPERATTGGSYGYVSGGGQIWLAQNANEDDTSLISSAIIRRIS